MFTLNIQPYKPPKEKEKLKKRYSNSELFREKYSKRISLLVPKQVLLMKMPVKKTSYKQISRQLNLSVLWKN